MFSNVDMQVANRFGASPAVPDCSVPQIWSTPPQQHTAFSAATQRLASTIPWRSVTPAEKRDGMSIGTGAAIAGLGITEHGKVFGKTARQFAARALRLAATDAGIDLSETDGLLVSSGVLGIVGIELQRQLGLTDQRLLLAGGDVQVAFGLTEGGEQSKAVPHFVEAKRGSSHEYETDRGVSLGHDRQG